MAENKYQKSSHPAHVLSLSYFIHITPSHLSIDLCIFLAASVFLCLCVSACVSLCVSVGLPIISFLYFSLSFSLSLTLSLTHSLSLSLILSYSLSLSISLSLSLSLSPLSPPPRPLSSLAQIYNNILLSTICHFSVYGS